ncbi:MAG: hypothetical protein WDN01_06465 [Rhizomicrobium sp.]
MTLVRPSSDPPLRKRGRPRKHPPALPSTRKRGAQPGNKNRWRHGRYSAAMRDAKASSKAEIGEINLRVEQALAFEVSRAKDRRPRSLANP